MFTQYAIIFLTRNTYLVLGRGKKPLALFLHLAEAFGAVYHEQLLGTLWDVGGREVANEVFANYLNERERYVQINSIYSNKRIVFYGGLQGTILGPILFSIIIYIHNIHTINTSGSVSCFADDTVVFYESDTLEEIKEKAEIDMVKIMYI